MVYTPSYTYPWSMSMPNSSPAQQSSNGIIWVQGEAGAKSYMVGAGQSVMLMDSESNVFYIKSSDQSGMPMPLRTFDYTERVAPKPEAVQPKMDYVTRDEFEKRLAELSSGKQSVRPTKREQQSE